MKTIVALTMMFLPGTFLASVLSMPMLKIARLSLYVAIVVPLTVAVVDCWTSALSATQLIQKRCRAKDVERKV
jgi:hypothetical protein